MTQSTPAQIYLQFFNGQRYPALGYGTFQAKDEELEIALEAALEVGYRHIDTAYLYENEKMIGDVLKRWIGSGKIQREDICVVTKLPPTGMRPEGVHKYIQKSLDSLQLEYVDLYLVHTPVGFKDTEGVQHGTSELDMSTDIVAIWKTMETLVDTGKAKSIGLSNFNSEQITRIFENARIQPANLQVELHAFFQQNDLVDFCKTKNIVVTAYYPLGNPSLPAFMAKVYGQTIEVPNLLGHPVVNALAKKHNKTSAQILLRHIVQGGISTIPKSSNPQRVRENFNIFDFVLDESDMKQMAALEQGARIMDMSFFKGHPEYPFAEPMEPVTTAT